MRSDNEHLRGIAAFVHAAEAGNFSLAAERMHLSRSAVAKSVARLEARLGVRLFLRTTRSHSLTDDGQLFYQRCVQILRDLELAEEELGQGRDEAVGKVRITMPVLLGRRCIAPVLFALAQQHAGLQLELSFTDRCVDMVEEGFDLAIRSGPLPDSATLAARYLGEQRRLLCASPSYLAQRGEPQTLAELAGHDGILYGRAAQRGEWRFLNGASGESAAAIGARFCMDDLEMMLVAAEAGLGIARLPSWLIGESLQAGRVQPVLTRQIIPAYPVHIVWPRARQTSRKLRIVIDALLDGVPTLLDV